MEINIYTYENSKITILRISAIFSLPRLSLLFWQPLFSAAIKIKKRSKMTSCLGWPFSFYSLLLLCLKLRDYPGEITRVINKMTSIMKNTYWKKNIRYITILLSLWFIVSFGCGILFVEQLNAIQIGGFKLGFWFAQQGSIFSFVVIIFTYIYLMNKLDQTHK